MTADDRDRATAELLEYLSDLVSRGAIYTGYRPSGSNERYTYEHLVFKVPR